MLSISKTFLFDDNPKIVRNANTILSALKEDEKDYITKTNILSWFKKNADRYDNIRILETKIENAIFEKLTQYFIIETNKEG